MPAIFAGPAEALRCWTHRSFYKRGRSCKDVLSALERRELREVMLKAVVFHGIGDIRLDDGREETRQCDTDAPLESRAFARCDRQRYDCAIYGSIFAG